MVNTWFTSDTHFGHENIIKYTGRPFKSLKEMDSELIRRWNARIKPDDIVYFLGDFCFRNSAGGKPGEGVPTRFEEYIKLLNGNIIFILGNHDYTSGVKSKMISAVLEFANLTAFCCHNPQDMHPDYKLNICGHVHQHWKSKKVGNTVLINVGVDQWNFYPVSLNEILDEYKKYIFG